MSMDNEFQTDGFRVDWLRYREPRVDYFDTELQAIAFAEVTTDDNYYGYIQRITRPDGTRVGGWGAP